MPGRVVERMVKGSFAFRVKMGDYEVEVNGEREEVLRTIKELPSLMADVYKAFEVSKPKATATLTVKTTAVNEEAPRQKYPKISHAESCSDAILSILATDWGKWRPRTIGELKQVFKANGLHYSGRTRAGVLTGLVRKGKVRRWKTDAGYVYILAEEEDLA
jgi:hypothetical protein